eukprot:19070-Heterococcus_DN1.PRE.2
MVPSVTSDEKQPHLRPLHHGPSVPAPVGDAQQLVMRPAAQGPHQDLLQVGWELAHHNHFAGSWQCISLCRHHCSAGSTGLCNCKVHNATASQKYRPFVQSQLRSSAGTALFAAATMHYASARRAV